MEFDTSVGWTCVGSDSECSLSPYNCTGMPTKQWMSSSTCGTGTFRVGSNIGVSPWGKQVDLLPRDTDFIWVHPPTSQSAWCKVHVPYDSLVPNEDCLPYPETTITIAAHRVCLLIIFNM